MLKGCGGKMNPYSLLVVWGTGLSTLGITVLTSQAADNKSTRGPKYITPQYVLQSQYPIPGILGNRINLNVFKLINE